MSAHVSCDPPELLHVAHCAQYSSWWINITRYFSLKTVHSISICCHIMNKAQGRAKHVKKDIYPTVAKCFPNQNHPNAFSVRATPSLSRAHTASLLISHSLRSSQISSSSQYLRDTWISDSSSSTCQTWETCLNFVVFFWVNCCDAHVGYIWGRLRFKTLFEVCPLRNRRWHIQWCHIYVTRF